MTAAVIVPRPVERVIVRPGDGITVVRIVQSGPPGRDGVARYEHVQTSASANWTVNHNLDRKPAAVRVLSPGGVEVVAGVLNISLNQLIVSFASPATGSVLVL